MATRKRPERLTEGTLPNRKCRWASVEEEQADRQAAAEGHLKVLQSQLPPLLAKLARIPDPRQPKKTKHKLVVLLVYGILLFMFHYHSRREANRELSRPGLWEVLRIVFPDLDSIPHADTLERLLREIPPESLEEALLERCRALLRSRKLLALMVKKHYVIAIDGTQKLVRHRPWDGGALHRRSGDGDTRYIAYVVEAALVSPQGITLPLAAEFCENLPGQSKQDCEQKAFMRLAYRLKKTFPHLRILLVIDGLYPTGPVMALCRRFRWDFMITLPQDCLPSVWQEAEALHRLDGSPTCSHQWGDRQQRFWWANHIEYEYRDPAGLPKRLTVHVVVCEEMWVEHDAQGQALPRQKRFAWISGQPLSPKNLHDRCNRAARRRWDIEESVLTEKHHGYQASHAFSWDWKAMKGWHYLMMIARFLNALACFSVALWDWVKERGFQGTIQFLRETYTGPWLNRSRLQALLTRTPQLRLII